MAFIQDAVCEFPGVCPPIIPPTTTTIPPSNPPPPTQNPNILESSTQPKATASPRIPPNPNSNLTDYVETDFDEPNDFKVEVEYVNELDERELEVYFERDKFNASGEIEKDVNSFLISMIFVIWRVFWN
ncbi:Protein CBG26226 [Caenorhabditis briggsae]|uniref:Protein CBG26226 n=1 Tax=Caenorhabditis briggsae TaxID=6238 RepID=B6IIY1_CAEBR|nr:Protein CBG26226 [Caenorhabditis briggsae]CAR99861.1 Protein CBG26226 [Caenorhabditis briggsae]